MTQEEYKRFQESLTAKKRKFSSRRQSERYDSGFNDAIMVAKSMLKGYYETQEGI